MARSTCKNDMARSMCAKMDTLNDEILKLDSYQTRLYLSLYQLNQPQIFLDTYI